MIKQSHNFIYSMESKQQNTQSFLPRSKIYQRFFDQPDLTYSISSYKTKTNNPQTANIQYLRSNQSDRQVKRRYIYTLGKPSSNHDLQKSKRAKTIDSEVRLPTIKNKKFYQEKISPFEKLNPRKAYLQPSLDDLLEKKKKKPVKTKKKQFKRICSVNCLKDQNKKQQKETSLDITPMRQYIAAEASANYPQTQLSRYLSKMRSLQQDSYNSKKYVYTTYFGIQPQFYKLETEYASQMGDNPNNLPLGGSQKLRVEIPMVPATSDIASFVKHYNPFNNQVIMNKLLRSPYFIIQHSRDELFFGEMVHDRKQGVGILIQDKRVFQGIFQSNLKISGLEINTSGIYKGQFANEKRNGHGQFQWFNGEYYIGEWKDGNRHGSGVWTNTHGDSYNGEWVKGKGEGYGVYIVDRQEYKGNFVGFKKDGWGKEKFSNGDSYDGRFREGYPDGKGKYTWNNGTKYQGEFIAGLRNGEGTLKTPDGFKYKGQFKDEKPQGLCEIHMPNGDVYHGYLHNGKKNGRGTLILRDSGKILDGYWQDDNFTQNHTA